MTRAAVLTLTAAAAGGAIVFIALFLGGYPAILAHERIGLVPLIAGLGAAVANSYRKGNLSKGKALTSVVLLGGWAGFLAVIR